MATRTPKPPMDETDMADLASSAAALADIDAEIDDVLEAADLSEDSLESGLEDEMEQLKMKELVLEIVNRTGQRKGEVRTAVQAALAVMGEALGEGREMHLPPMGKMKVNRIKATPRGQALIVKLVQNRRAAPMPEAEDDPLAEFDQDS